MEQEKKSNGAFIGLAIIIIILVIGGIYVWQSKVDTGALNNSALTAEEAKSLDTLDQDLNTLDTNVGVDVNTLQ